MNLATYLSELRGRGSALAASIGVHPVMVSQWGSKTKPVPIERCAAIERATNGAVMRWDLRPDDWMRIWPELVAMPGAPKAEAKAG